MAPATHVSVEALRSLQDSITAAIDDYAANPGEETGIQLAKSAQQVLQVVKNPFEDLLIGACPPIYNVCMRIAIDLNLFAIITKEKITLDQVAEKTKANKVLLMRILRVLTACDIFVEEDVYTYSSTPISESMIVPPIRDFFKTQFDSFAPITLQIPGFLRKNGYESDIVDLSNNPAISTYGELYFDMLRKHPDLEADFGSAMQLNEMVPPEMRPAFPYSNGVEAFEKARLGADGIFIVDVGGGKGQALDTIRKQWPSLPGRFILQDLPYVVATLDKSQVNFEPMAHDFFEPQPVKGAKYYHIRSVLHDWPQKECISILKHLRDALEPGFSSILIQEMVLGEKNVPKMGSILDIILMCNCGTERTQSQWYEIITAAGLQIKRIVRATAGASSMIEVVPA